MKKLLLPIVLALFWPAFSHAQFGFPPPIGAEVRVAPAPVAAMGKHYLGYEVQLSSLAPMPLRITTISVFAGGSDVPLAEFAEGDLASILLNPAGAAGNPAGTLPAGGTDIAYFWLEVDPDLEVSSLRHVIGLATTGEQVMTGSIEARVPVQGSAAVSRLGPPLKGGTWVIAHGPDNWNGHRRIPVPQHGRLNIPQRWAIDYFGVGPDSQTWKGDAGDVANYHAYGAEVLAVADGVIAVAHDGVPDNNPPHPSERAVAITLETVAGNHVLLDIGDGLYGFYAHFKPGSLRVKAGDKVKKGQVIALLGNSGNTPQPHLHFTVADHTGILANEGLPYVFERFAVVGHCNGSRETWGWFDRCEFTEPDQRTGEIPVSWKLIEFPR